MKGLSWILLVSLAMPAAAHAEEWHTYTYPDPGFAIEFPGVPDVQTSKLRNSVGLTLPVTRYVLRQDRVQYTLSVVNYSSTNADALGTIRETARSFSAKAKVNADTGAKVNGNHGRELTITESDGSRSDIAIFFVNNHLYTAVGQAFPPNPVESSAETARFQESLQFPSDDGGFLGLFGGHGRRSFNATSSTATMGSSSANGVSGTGASSSNAGDHVRAVANRPADAACVGKSAGDVVRLDTPTGPVLATCTLTARPNAPSGGTP
jgi:hypothetical protein